MSKYQGFKRKFLSSCIHNLYIEYKPNKQDIKSGDSYSEHYF